MIEGLINAMQGAGIDFDSDSLADAIWLATQLPAEPDRSPSPFRPMASPAPPPVAYQQARGATEAIRPSYERSPQQQGQGAALRAHPAIEAAPMGHSLRLPTPRSLREGLNAALGALAVRDRRPSTVIDIEATVEAYATSCAWVTKHVPGERRWLSAVLVSESGPQAPIWQSTLEEFTRLLRSRGAFRSVRRLELFTGPCGNAMLRKPGAQHPSEARGAAWWRDEIIIVASDFVSDGWQAVYGRCLEHWRAGNHVLLLHLLPQQLWGHTWTGVPEWQLSGQIPGGDSNSLLALPKRSRHSRKGSQSPQRPLPLPIAGLTPEDLRSWSSVVVAQPGEMQAVGLAARLAARPPTEALQRETSAEGLVRAFKSNATPLCIKLATYLSLTAPLTLQMMQWVQIAMIPTASTAEIAEFFLSGLIETRYPAPEPADVVYDFISGVRGQLERGVSIFEAADVQRAIGAKLELHNWTEANQGSLVEIEMVSARSDLPRPLRMFAEVSAGYLKRRGLAVPTTIRPEFSGFLDEAEIAEKVSATLDRHESLVGQLLLLSSETQQTWLVFSTAAVTIVLDDASTRPAGSEIQAAIPIDGVFKPNAREEKDGSAVFGFSGLTGHWYYSKALYTAPDLLENAFNDMMRSVLYLAALHNALRHLADTSANLRVIQPGTPLFKESGTPYDGMASGAVPPPLASPIRSRDGSLTEVVFARLSMTAAPVQGERSGQPYFSQFTLDRALTLLNIPHTSSFASNNGSLEPFNPDIILHVSREYSHVDGVLWRSTGDPNFDLACLFIDRVQRHMSVVAMTAPAETAEVDLANKLMPMLREQIDSGMLPSLKDEIEAALAETVGEADWIVEANSYLDFKPHGEHGELMGWDFYTASVPLQFSHYEDGMLFISCKVNAQIQVSCSFSFSLSSRERGKKRASPYRKFGQLHAKRRIRPRIDILLAVSGVRKGQPELQGIEIEHIAEQVDFGNIEPPDESDSPDA